MVRVRIEESVIWGYTPSIMKKGFSLALVVALGFGIFVYAQEDKKSGMPVAKEVPKSMTKEEAAKLTDEEWKKRLTPEQYHILRKAGTERSNGQVYKEFKAQGGGSYYCAGCNTELFSSKEKFDSHCGWPSFYDPSKAKNVKTKVDNSGFMARTEVLCAVCDGHLGHVFLGEGFATPTDKRFCINGTSLKFVPVEVVEAAKKAAVEKGAKKEEAKEAGEETSSKSTSSEVKGGE